MLWQIILAAQRSPIADKLPFRALFEAYDSVLAQYGLDSNHDQVYLRFLFHLGSKKSRRQTLADVFKTFLRELGFQVEVDGQLEGTEGGSVSRAESAIDEDDGNIERFVGRRRTRRASFSSVVGAEEETTKRSRQRDVSRASTSRVVSQAEKARTRKPSVPPTSASPAKAIRKRQSSNVDSAIPRPRGLTSPRSPHSLHTIHDRRSHADSQERSGNDSRRRPSSSIRPSNAGNSEDQLSSPLEDDLSSVLSEDLSSHDVPHPSQHARLSRLPIAQETGIAHAPKSRSQVERRTEASRSSASSPQIDRPILEAIASRRDRETLLRQSFELWRNKWIAKKQAAETKRFFGQLERRAARARDLYLLTKAFTHWAQSASEQIQKTSEARQHILRLRYFNAWREITAVNELKVRRIRLRKFLNTWKQRYVANFHTESKAIVVYRGNLAKQIYWRWFWAFCNERAPVWRAQQLRKKYFDKWRQTRRTIAERHHIAIEAKHHSSTKGVLTIWKAKHLILGTLTAQTDTSYRQRLLANTFRQWRTQLTYEPRARQVSSMADWRIAAATFTLLRKRAMLERQAALVNRLRIMRNAWTLWNDGLRCQALRQLIDERVMLQALYIWVIRERYKLLMRLTQKRLVQRCLRKLHARHQAILSQRENTAEKVRTRQRRSLLSAVVQFWHLQTQLNLEKQQQAIQFARPRATAKALAMMSARYSDVQRMKTKATFAIWFLRIKHATTKWQDAVAGSQREKRRIAYAQMRRTVKMNIVRHGLLHWHWRTLQIGALQAQASETLEKKEMSDATTFFIKWISRTQSILSIHAQVEQELNLRYVTNALQSWHTRLDQHQTMGETARVFVGLHVSKAALDSLRVLHLKVLDLNSRREAASTVREWHQKRTVKGLLALWAEKTMRKRTVPEDNDQDAEDYGQSSIRAREHLMPYTPYRGAQLNLMPSIATSRRESVTPFSSQAPTVLATESDTLMPDLTLAASRREEILRTSIPAYLSTPSKRANRTRALVERAGSTTPADTPIDRGLFKMVSTDRGAAGRKRDEDLRVSVLGRSVIGRRP